MKPLLKDVLNETNGIIEAPIARKSDSIIEREVNEKGQFARTRYEIIRQYQDYAHIKLKLDTGRTHQIRVHMSYLGHPLIGDDLYGGQHYFVITSSFTLSIHSICASDIKKRAFVFLSIAGRYETSY